MKAPIALLLALASGPLLADSLSLDLNNDALRLNYQNEMNRNYVSDFAWTHVKDQGNTFTGGIILKQKINDLLTADIGGKVVFQQHDILPDGTAIAVGGALRLSPAELKNASFSASAFFAPNVLSFGDMDNYQEFELRAEYRFSDQLTGYVGYRDNRADYNNSSTKVNNAKLYDGGMIGGESHF